MPAIRPEAVSNFIRLSYEVAAAVVAFVSEHGAVDALLSAIVDELSPHKARISYFGTKYNFLARADEQFTFAPVLIVVCAVVSFVQRQTIYIAVFC